MNPRVIWIVEGNQKMFDIYSEIMVDDGKPASPKTVIDGTCKAAVKTKGSNPICRHLLLLTMS